MNKIKQRELAFNKAIERLSLGKKNRALDKLINHRLGVHGFNDWAEFVPDGCPICDKLQAEYIAQEVQRGK